MCLNLGVFIDSTLSWEHQISNISKKISQTIGIMYINDQLFTFVGNEIKISIL